MHLRVFYLFLAIIALLETQKAKLGKATCAFLRPLTILIDMPLLYVLLARYADEPVRIIHLSRLVEGSIVCLVCSCPI